MLIEETHEVEWGTESANKPVRYTGTSYFRKAFSVSNEKIATPFTTSKIALTSL